MDPLPLSRAFTLVEPGPVILVTTHDGTRPNIMTVSWTMVRSFDAEYRVVEPLVERAVRQPRMRACHPDRRNDRYGGRHRDVLGCRYRQVRAVRPHGRSGTSCAGAADQGVPGQYRMPRRGAHRAAGARTAAGVRGPYRCSPDRHSAASCCRRRDLHRRWRAVRPARSDAGQAARRAVGGPKRSPTMVKRAAAQLRQTGHSCIMQPLQVASEGRADKICLVQKGVSDPVADVGRRQ